MFPKAFLFHQDPLEGLETIVSSPIILTFNSYEIYQNKKTHSDVYPILKLYQSINFDCFPKLITTIYNYNQLDMLAVILKFNISHYCHIKSQTHFDLAKSLLAVSDKLDRTMQNMSGLEKSLSSTYKNLTLLNLQNSSPMNLNELSGLSTALSARDIAQKKLKRLIQSEFIDGLC